MRWPDGRELIYYDQRGGGRSPVPRDVPVGWTEQVADLEALREQLGIWSGSPSPDTPGAACSRCSTRWSTPDRVERLALISPAPPGARRASSSRRGSAEAEPRPAFQEARRALRESGLRERDPDAYQQRIFELSVAPYFHDPARARDLTPFRVTGRTQQEVWASLGDFDLRARLPRAARHSLAGAARGERPDPARGRPDDGGADRRRIPSGAALRPRSLCRGARGVCAARGGAFCRPELRRRGITFSPMSRPTPFDARASSALSESQSSRESASSLRQAGHDPADRDGFLMDREVVTLLRDLRPEEGLGEAMDQMVALVHHAYLAWAAGEATSGEPGCRPRSCCVASPARSRPPGSERLSLLRPDSRAAASGPASSRTSRRSRSTAVFVSRTPAGRAPGAGHLRHASRAGRLQRSGGDGPPDREPGARGRPSRCSLRRSPVARRPASTRSWVRKSCSSSAGAPGPRGRGRRAEAP